jgi:hypothetical protein
MVVLVAVGSPQVSTFTPRHSALAGSHAGLLSSRGRRFALTMVDEGSTENRTPRTGTTTTNLDKIKYRAIKAGNAESKVVPGPSRTLSRSSRTADASAGKVRADVFPRRAALAAGAFGVVGLSGLGRALRNSRDVDVETSAALKKLRARRAANQQPEPLAGESMEEVDEVETAGERLEKAGEAIEATLHAVAGGVVTVGKGMANVAHGVAEVGSATLHAGQTAVHVIEKTAEVLADAAEKAAPVLQKGADTALPVLQDAFAKAEPFVQQATDKAGPVLDRLQQTLEPSVRQTGEALDKLVHNPQISQAVSDSVRSTNEAVHRVTDSPQLQSALAAMRPAIPFVQGSASLVWGAMVWFGKLAGTVSSDGSEGAKAEILATLQHQASSAAQVTVDVVLPAAKTGAQVTLNTLADLYQRALETPNGQLLQEKVSSTLSDMTSQKDAVVMLQFSLCASASSLCLVCSQHIYLTLPCRWLAPAGAGAIGGRQDTGRTRCGHGLDRAWRYCHTLVSSAQRGW